MRDLKFIPPVSPNILVFEPDARGHAHEWLMYLTEAARHWPSHISLSLLVPPELAGRLLRLAPLDGALTLRVVSMTETETALCNHARLLVSGVARWWVMRRYLKRTRADHGIFMSIDHATLLLAFHTLAGTTPLSGILFRPSVHYAMLYDIKPTLQERKREIRKQFLYARFFTNPIVCNVWTFDSYFSEFARIYYKGGEKIRAIPDPAPSQIAVAPAECEVADRIPGQRTAFLLFGELTVRKGVLVLLKALTVLPKELAASIAIVIAGRAEPHLHQQIIDGIQQVSVAQPRLWIHFEGRFLHNGEIAALVSRCDVILAPYQRFVGSSGILMWAAKFSKPMITQDYGLLGQLVRTHGLGHDVDTTSPAVLADAISGAVRLGPRSLYDTERAAAFVTHRTPEKFARALLHGALAAPVRSHKRLNTNWRPHDPNCS